MGASESSYRPPPAQRQETRSPSNENRPSEAVVTISECDPRSPSSAIQRTPIRMKVTEQAPPDPRSPSNDFQRTPLRSVQEKDRENLAQSLFSEVEQQRNPPSTSS